MSFTVQDLQIKRKIKGKIPNFDVSQIKNKIKARNLMIVKLFNSRINTKMRIQEIAAAADISRKHVYTIVKQVQEGKYEQGS